MAAANQDEAIAQLNQAIDYLKADKTGDAANAAKIADLTTQRDALAAANTLTTKQRDDAYAVLKSKGFNPDGTPISNTPPPVIVDSLTLTPGMDSQGFNQVLSVVSWGNGKAPKMVQFEHLDPDIGGAAWSTGPLPGTTDRYVFTWLPNGAQRIKVSSLDAGDTRSVTKSITLSGITNTPPAPIPPPVGTLTMAHCAYTDQNGTGGIDAFGSMTKHPLGMILCYMLSSDTNAQLFDSLIPYMQAHKGFRLLLGVNPIVDEPGNFESTRVVDQMRALGRKIGSYGPDIASRIIIRFGYECNGDWMPWGRQFPGNSNGARFSGMWTRCWNAYREGAVSPWALCFNAWDDDVILIDGFLPADKKMVDYITSDNYDAWLSGDRNQRWLQLKGRLDRQVRDGKKFGKPVAQDEWGVWTSANSMGGGDNEVYTKNFLEYGRTNNYAWLSYFNSPQGQVETTLGQNPRSLAAYQQFTGFAVAA